MFQFGMGIVQYVPIHFFVNNTVLGISSFVEKNRDKITKLPKVFADYNWSKQLKRLS